MPLLAPPTSIKKKAVSKIKIHVHGRLRLRQFLRVVDPIDANLRLDWRPNLTWSADLAATRVWQGSIRSTSLSGGVSYRF